MGLYPCSGRLAKARRCPHSGTVMGARRDGPSMAHRGWRGVLPRHPHNRTCVQPSVRGIRVVRTILWLQQKQKQKFETAPIPCEGESALEDFNAVHLIPRTASRLPQLPFSCASVLYVGAKTICARFCGVCDGFCFCLCFCWNHTNVQTTRAPMTVPE